LPQPLELENSDATIFPVIFVFLPQIIFIISISVLFRINKFSCYQLFVPKIISISVFDLWLTKVITFNLDSVTINEYGTCYVQTIHQHSTDIHLTAYYGLHP